MLSEKEKLAVDALKKACGDLLWLANNKTNIHCDPSKYYEFVTAAEKDGEEARRLCKEAGLL